MEITIKEPLSKNLTCLLGELTTSVESWGNQLISYFSISDLANTSGKTYRSAYRNLKSLQNKGFIDFCTRRGKNGGTIVAFNTEKLDFAHKPNPITDSSLTLEEIRDRVFPKKEVKEPQRHYRSKEIIAEERALRKYATDKNAQLNMQLEKNFFITREFFDQTDDPEGNYRGWMVSRMFQAYAVLAYNDWAEEHDENSKVYKEYKIASLDMQFYTCMPKGFFGTYQFTTFKKLAAFCAENDIDPLAYLTTQFEYAKYLFEHGKAKKHAIPYVNSLITKEAIERAEENHRYTEYQKKTYHHWMNTKYSPRMCIKYPIVQALSQLWYSVDSRPKDEGFDINFADLAQASQFSTKSNTMYAYYQNTLQAVESNKNLTTNETQAVTRWLKEQTITHGYKTSVGILKYSLMHELQFLQARAIHYEHKKDYYMLMGNFTKSLYGSNSDIEYYVRNGELIDKSFFSNLEFPSIMYLASNYRNLYVDITDLRSAISKLGTEVIPVNNYGMLDVQSLFEKDNIDFKKEDTEDWGFSYE